MLLFSFGFYLVQLRVSSSSFHKCSFGGQNLFFLKLFRVGFKIFLNHYQGFTKISENKFAGMNLLCYICSINNKY